MRARWWLALGLGVLALTPSATMILFDNPAKYVRWQDRGKALLWFASTWVGEPCMHTKIERLPDGTSFPANVYDDTPACIRFDAPRRFDGVWLDELENQQFLDHATRLPPPADLAAQHDTTWLTVPEAMDKALPHHKLDPNQGYPHPAAWRISFIGRHSHVKGAYGHMGMFDHEIIVERIVSITPLSR